MDLSVIIVNWNTKSLTIQCLHSIYHNTEGIRLEIIVVDNGSTDDSVSTIQALFPEVILIENEQNQGFATANNQGLALGTGRYLMLLNSDTIVRPNALSKMVHFMDQFTDVGVAGCRLLNSDGTLQESWSKFPTFWSELTGQNLRSFKVDEVDSGVYDVDWVGGACMLTRNTTLDEIGGLDESFFMYSEETDWCFRMKANNWRVCYLTDVEIVHLGGGSASRTSLLQLVRLYESKIRFFRKHYGAWQARVLRYGLALVNTLSLLKRGAMWTFHRKSNPKNSERLRVQSRLVWYLLQETKYAATER